MAETVFRYVILISIDIYGSISLSFLVILPRYAFSSTLSQKDQNVLLLLLAILEQTSVQIELVSGLAPGSASRVSMDGMACHFKKLNYIQHTP